MAGKPEHAFNILAAELQDDHNLPISWIEGYSTEDIATMQRKDTDIGIVKTWLEKEEYPTKSQLHPDSPYLAE